MSTMTRRDRINTNRQSRTEAETSLRGTAERRTSWMPIADYDGAIFPDMAD
ncbi:MULTISPECIES: hypothetical protein [Arthrobacter]|uniref:hypothetical protein n=1 Tax=Arthrobacter TaxID=1663 RepID=UPI00197B0042|nr:MULTISPECIES: hypothetical protein [Arthrobacter]